jgi:tetratricopeptide (TPR) repeat protein
MMSSRETLFGVTVLLLGLSMVAAAATQQIAPARHEADLKQLDAHLAAEDPAAVAALLRRLEPELDRDERFALDVAYRLIAHRQFPEARAQWSRVARRVQESLRAGSSQAPTPDAERGLQRRVAETWFVQGLLTARLGQKEEALRLLRDADGYGFPPLDSPLMLLAADCLFELKEHALAVQAYQEVVSRASDDLTARLRLGASLYSLGRLSAAEKELGEVLRRAPGLLQARFYLGAVLFEQNRTEEARAHLERELALDPRCYGCMAKLAHIAYLNGDDRQCESWLAGAAALDPSYVETNLVYGLLYNRAARYDQAIQHLSRVVEQAPDYAKAQYQLALAYQRSGNAHKAREHTEIYTRLVQAQKARSMGVRGSKE